MPDRDERGRTVRRGPPRPTSCQSPRCRATVVFLPSQANPGRKVCADLTKVRAFVLVRADDDLVLADQDAINAGNFVARNVLVYASHHGGLKGVERCPDAPAYTRRDHRPQTSTTTARKR